MCGKRQQTVFPWKGDVLVRQWRWESHQQRQAARKHEEGDGGQFQSFYGVCNLLCVRCILISIDNQRTELQSDLEKAPLKQRKRDMATHIFARCVCVPATPMHAYYNSWLWHLDGWTNFICIGAGQDIAFEMISLNHSKGNSTHPHPTGGKRCARCCEAQEGLGFLQDSSCRWGAARWDNCWTSREMMSFNVNESISWDFEISWVFLAGSRSSQWSCLASSSKTWMLQPARLELLVTKTCIMCIHRCLIVISSSRFSSLNMTIHFSFCFTSHNSVLWFLATFSLSSCPTKPKCPTMLNV